MSSLAEKKSALCVICILPPSPLGVGWGKERAKVSLLGCVHSLQGGSIVKCTVFRDTHQTLLFTRQVMIVIRVDHQLIHFTHIYLILMTTL